MGGFLLFVFILLVIGVVIYIFKELVDKDSVVQKTEKKEEKKEEKVKKEKEDLGKYYQLKNTFFTYREKPFFDELQRQNNGRYTILSKVRMEDVVNVVKGLNYKKSYSMRNRIKSRHIDFVILDKFSGKILAVIELDDNSHNWKKAEAGDDLKNAVFSFVGVKFYRVKVGETYSDKVAEILSLV